MEKIEPINEGLYYTVEGYMAGKHNDDLACVINILVEKVNLLIEKTNQLLFLREWIKNNIKEA